MPYRDAERPRPRDTAARPRRPRPLRRLPPEVLTDAEVGALLAAAVDPEPKGVRVYTGPRDRALIAVLYRAGLRISEALQVLPKDVDAAGGAIRVLFAKGGRDRTVGIDAGGLAVLQEWMAARARLGLNGREPLFCTIRGYPMSSGYVRRLLPRLAERAGIAKRVHAHGLRHTHAAQLRAEGVDIAIISRQLGHRSISTTAVYLNHLAPYEVVEAMRKRVWGAAA